MVAEDAGLLWDGIVDGGKWRSVALSLLRLVVCATDLFVETEEAPLQRFGMTVGGLEPKTRAALRVVVGGFVLLKPEIH